MNRYKLTLEQISVRNEELRNETPIVIEFNNHDEIFNIVDRATKKDLFKDTQQSAQFSIGLKMFSEIMLKHKTEPIFADLLPAFGTFMKRLKAA